MTKKILHLLLLFTALGAVVPFLRAAEIASVPSAMNQGGMIMPIIYLADADNLDNPTHGTLKVLFAPTNTPVLAELQTWSPGNWFASDAPWRSDLGSPEGVGGTPTANAGTGDLFSSRYGFTFSKVVLGVTNASVPSGQSLGLRLLSLSSPTMEIHNYGNTGGITLWDQVFPTTNSQVLWDGMMWHSYFSLPSNAAPGTYTAQFEVFIANRAFDTNAGTGRADYTVGALAAAQNPAFTTATLDYTWTVIPEPATNALLALGLTLIIVSLVRRKRKMADVKIRSLATVAFCALSAAAHTEEISFVPGPDEQGGMIMPQVFLTGTDDPYNPTHGTIGVSMDTAVTPVLAGLQHWWPGAWFASGATWRTDLGSPSNIGGTPPANAGHGDLFNCQYGFTFVAAPGSGAAFVPVGKSLAIRRVSASSPLLRSFNYDEYDNLWDEVLSTAHPQVLWNGGMWHNYHTLPANAPPGTYTATYEIFIADTAFTEGTGFVDYSPGALVAAADLNFTPVLLTYTWIIPAPPVASIQLDNGTPVIRVPSIAGRTYRLQASTSLAPAIWGNLGAAKNGTGDVLEFYDTTSPRPAKKFYRVTEIQ